MWVWGGGDVPADGIAIGLLLECRLRGKEFLQRFGMGKFFIERHAVGVWG